MKHKQARLSTEELYELKWLVGSLLSLLSLWSLWSLDLQSELYILGGGLVVLLALLRPTWVKRIPARVWRPVGFLLLLVVGVDFILHLPEFMPPLLRMVVGLLVYRTLAPRHRRDELQLVLLCLFCLVISGVLTVSLLFAFQILLFTPVAMGMLFLICLLDRGPDSREYDCAWTDFRVSRLMRRVFQILDFRVLFLGAVMFAFVVAVSTVLFVLTPRFDLDQAIPYLQIKTEARAGFSENVKLGQIAEILVDRSVAMRVDVPSVEAMDSAPYWRMLTLDKYDEGYFRMSESLKVYPYREYPKVRELMGRDLVDDGVRIDRHSAERWTIYLEGGVSQFLPVPGMFHSIRFEGMQDLVVLPGLHHVGLDSVRQRVFSYQIEDLQWTRRFPALQTEVAAFTAQSTLEAGVDVHYPLTTLELNMNSADRAYLTELNATILEAGAIGGVTDYCERVTDYMWQRYRYSLSPDSAGRGADAVVEWLRSGRAGHCEYFAGAFILLARDAGYPARMVVGFAGGAWNMVEDYFVVRNDNAHAWVEIYDVTTQEWIRVDPTPGSGSSHPDAILANTQNMESGWNAWLDSLRIQWYRRVVNFDQADQVDLALNMQSFWDEWTAGFKQRMRGVGDRLKLWWQKPFSVDGLLPVAVVVASVGVLIVVWRTRYSLMSLFYRLLRRPKALDPVRREASRYLRRLQAKGLDSGVRAELVALRFGPSIDARAAKPIFIRARRVLRQRS